jgi:outer membrane protein TolC
MRTFRVLLALTLLPAVLGAQRAPAVAARTTLRLSMEDAVRRALDTGDEIRIARAQVQQARGQVTQAWASALPEVRGSITYQRTFASVFSSSGSSGPTIAPFSPDTTAPLADRLRYLENQYNLAVPRGIGDLFKSLPFGRPTTYVAALTMNQTLFQGGKIGAGIQGAHAFERAAQATLNDTQEELAYRVKLAYLNALFAGRMLEISEATQAQVNEHLRTVTVNHRVGATGDYDLLRSQVESANQEPQVIASRNGRENAELELKRLVNVPVDQPLELTAAALTAADSLPEVDAVALDAGAGAPDRSSIAAAEANVEFRRQALRVFRGDAYPLLRFTMTYGGQAYPSGTFPTYSEFRKDWNASVSLSMPLFDGFRNRGIVQQARAELTRAEAQASQAQEGVAIQVAQARSEMDRAHALVAARRQTVAQATRAYHLADVRYTNGIASSIEVSDARLALQQARVNEAQSTRDYLVAMAGLERALGRPVPLLRPGQRGTAGTAGMAGEAAK